MKALDVLGMVIRQAECSLESEWGVEPWSGLVVTAVRQASIADLTGIACGDIIAEVDGMPARSFDDLEGVLVRRESRDSVRILFRRDRAWRFVTIPYLEEQWPV